MINAAISGCVRMAHEGDLRGLDKEVHAKVWEGYDVQLERSALTWLASITGTSAPSSRGDKGDALFEWLKTGVILCQALNSIRPETVPSRSIALVPRNMLEERVRFRGDGWVRTHSR